MPVLYSCVVNVRRKIIIQGVDPKYKSNYAEQVLSYYDQFVMFGRKTIALDEKHNLHYM